MELWLPAGDASLCSLRARQGYPAIHGRGRSVRSGSALRRLSIGRTRSDCADAFPAQASKTSYRALAKRARSKPQTQIVQNLRNSRSISWRRGADGWAPRRVTEIAAAALA